MPLTKTKCPVFASEWRDSGGISVHTAQWATGRRIIEPIAMPTMISAVFVNLLLGRRPPH